MADSSAITQAPNPAQPTPKPEKKSHIYPAPFTVSPISRHTQTLLLLHGRGSNGEKFGREFLASQTAAGKSIQEHLPGMKFIFPTAKKRRAKWYNRAFISLSVGRPAYDSPELSPEQSPTDISMERFNDVYCLKSNVLSLRQDVALSE
jgi:hypothetical protein